MKRSGGDVGRPMHHWSIDQLEAHAKQNEFNSDELLVLKNELGFRSSKRAKALANLVTRLLRNPDH